MNFSRRRNRGAQDDVNPYWISFSDLMSALLLVFILAVVVLVLQLIEKQNELSAQQDDFSSQQTAFTAQIGTLQEAELARAAILQEIDQELQAQGIRVRVSENNTVLSIPSALLGFDSASSDLKPEYQGVAQTIGSVISSVITEGDRLKYLDTVFVEGHTDNLPFDGLDGTGNWGLSTFRAISLWTYWEDNLTGEGSLDQLVNPEGRPLFSVSGYAETRPSSEAQITNEERALNRRVDIRFTIVRPSSDDLLEIQENFQADSD